MPSDEDILKKARRDEVFGELRGLIKEASKEAVLEILAEQASTRTGDGTATDATDTDTSTAKPPAKKTAPAKATGNSNTISDWFGKLFSD